MWARQKNEWWPAEVADVSEGGMLCVSFIGWDSRHNVWMEPPDANCDDPQIVFEAPSNRRRAPERLVDQVQASAGRKGRLAIEFDQVASGRSPPRERPAKRLRTLSICAGTSVRVIEGASAGTTGDVVEGKSGFYRVRLHETQQVITVRGTQLCDSASSTSPIARAPPEPPPREPAEVVEVLAGQWAGCTGDVVRRALTRARTWNLRPSRPAQHQGRRPAAVAAARTGTIACGCTARAKRRVCAPAASHSHRVPSRLAMRHHRPDDRLEAVARESEQRSEQLLQHGASRRP